MQGPKWPLFYSHIDLVWSLLIIGTGYEGTQPEFPFPNLGDPSGTPTDSKKNKPFISFKPF